MSLTEPRVNMKLKERNIFPDPITQNQSQMFYKFKYGLIMQCRTCDADYGSTEQLYLKFINPHLTQHDRTSKKQISLRIISMDFPPKYAKSKITN